ncbi:hypothetical protein CHELA1G11_12435 [Hyphomicrobiales bacterium]|nr:hypothetical protein CHELA1G2_11872 [Hyphomicrobiales bacterium]CAH1664815.1 hypothetical protein CHELA1G11_12435 [Hyphomicrobiales bacterium]
MPIPLLDSEASRSCPDPGIDRNPKIAVVQHRHALVVCEGCRALAAGSYEAVRDEFGVKGEDFRSMRRFRKTVDSTASKIGTAIILALVGGLITLLTLGFRAFSLQ